MTHVLLTWLSGLGGGAVGGALGGAVGYAGAEAGGASDDFSDLGLVLFSVLLGILVCSALAVFVALKAAAAVRPLLSGVVFVLVSAAFFPLVSWVGAVLLPIDVTIEAGALLVAPTATFGGAVVARWMVGAMRVRT